jgi:hypothetical protein
MGFSDAKLGNTPDKVSAGDTNEKFTCDLRMSGYDHGYAPDKVGVCDANEKFTSTKNLCMSGYDHGFASVRNHH